MPPGQRIAIIHYTAAPAIGGVEGLIGSQVRALRELGHAARVIVGRGGPVSDAEVCRLPLLDPDDRAIADGVSRLASPFPDPDHPLVGQILRDLRPMVVDVSQCWVHNAFTVYLNPFLSVALGRLAPELPSATWVAWCHDLSATSRYWGPTDRGDRFVAPALPGGLTYVTDSESRRAELSSLLGLDRQEILVIPPPLDVDGWLDISPEAGLVADRLNLPQREPVLLVPAKLLPHKRLDRAVRLTACLRQRFPRPLVLLTAAPSPHEEKSSADVARRLRALRLRLGLEDVVHLLPDLLGRPTARRTVRDLMLLCDLVFLPSEEEGYGVPLLEAAACRTPVLCSDIPSFREAGGEAATYFAPDIGEAELAAQVTSIVAQPANRRRRQVVQSMDRFRKQVEGLLWRRVGWEGDGA